MPNTWAGTPSASNVSLGRGSIYIDRIDANGVSTGYIHLGNCDAFGVQPSVEKKQLANFMVDTTAPYKEVNVKTDLQMTISGFEFAPEVLALNTLGTVVAYTQSAATVVAEALATASVTKTGRSFKTLKRNISALAVKQGGTTLTLTTDYTFDATTGMISFPLTSAVVDASAVTVDYTAAAVVAADGVKKIQVANNGSIEGKVFFSPEPAAGPEIEATYFRVNLAPDGELSLISEDFNKWTLSGSVQDDSAGAYGGSTSSPYGELIVR